MPYKDTPRCPRCQRWAYPGQRHICVGQLPRCANPRCRRLLPYFPKTTLCARCRVEGWAPG